jgi:DNA-binding NarL/FixJ family response regulator
MVRILLADDHGIVRQGIKSLLEGVADFQVVGEAESGVETIKLCKKLEPEILVLDIMMDDIAGTEVARQVKNQSPGIGIVILSMYGDKMHVMQALQAGASAYVMKKSASSELIQAVREVHIGRRFLSSPLSEMLADTGPRKKENGRSDPYMLLSNREREVFHMAAHGYTNTEIAEKLFISRRTVETHRANAMHKLNLVNQTELIRYALQKGILPADS